MSSSISRRARIGLRGGDTLEAAFSNLEIDPMQAVVTGMTETLIRKKVLYSYRLGGIYFIVAIAGRPLRRGADL